MSILSILHKTEPKLWTIINIHIYSFCHLKNSKDFLVKNRGQPETGSKGSKLNPKPPEPLKSTNPQRKKKKASIRPELWIGFRIKSSCGGPLWARYGAYRWFIDERRSHIPVHLWESRILLLSILFKLLNFYFFCDFWFTVYIIELAYHAVIFT